MDQAEIEQTLNTSIEEQAFSGVISIRQKDYVLYARSAGYVDRVGYLATKQTHRSIGLDDLLDVDLLPAFWSSLLLGK